MDEFGQPAPEPGAVTPENPDQQPLPLGDGADAAGASGEAETDEQREQRLQQAARTLNEERKRTRDNTARRLQDDRDEWRNLAKQLAAERQQPAPQQRQNEAPRAPTKEFNPETGKPFTDYEDYVEARATWRARQEVQQALTQKLQEAAEQSQRLQAMHENQSVAQQHAARNRAFARSVPDFEEITNRDDIEVPPAAAEAIKRLPNGPAVVYAIGKWPEIEQTMNNMGPLEQVVYVGQLSSWLASNMNPQISNSAPAGRHVGGRPAAADTPPSDTEAYMKWANKKFGRR